MRLLQLFYAVALGLPALVSLAAPVSYPLSLRAPKLETLQTSLDPTGGTVHVSIEVAYDLAGVVTYTGTLDGTPVAGKANVKTAPTGVTTYKFALRAPGAPGNPIFAPTGPSAVSISGTVGVSTAACSYSGPKGRTNVPANAVTLAVVQPVPATLEISPLISDKNIITGSARIDADYTTNPIVNGTVKGKVSSNLVSLVVKHDKRSATFTGKRVGNAYVGPLRLVVPPARETITNFSLPLTDVSVASGLATFRGTLTIVSNRLPMAAAGSMVTVRTDANADGKFMGKESVLAKADAQGKYQITIPVMRGRPVLLEIRRSGYTEVLQSIPSVIPGTVFTRNATLQSIEPLEISGASAQSADGSILLEGLPANIESIQARVFNPATESAQFPGQFADNTGNLLVSSVFSAIEAQDQNGRSVTNLGTGVTMCLKVPAESWASLQDLTPGNSQIDVPLYYYDESSGQWKRHDTNGWLEDAAREKIPEDQLAAIRDGSFGGDIFAVGSISHFSWWNIDWPISSHTCVKGVIVGTNGIPVSGATVSASGLTYTGVSGPETTGPDGAFCLEIMRSENEGEDVDNDGVLGETQQIQLKVQSGLGLYSFGPISNAVTAATCADGTGLNLGSVMISDASRLSVSFCTVTGRVVYSGISQGGNPALAPGDGVRFAQVIGFDPEALADGGTCSNCLVTTTDSSGYFSLTLPILAGANISAVANVTGESGAGFFIGQVATSGCPTGLVTIAADYYNLGSTTTLTLYNGAEVWGNATIQNRMLAVVSLPVGQTVYLGYLNDVDPPGQTGAWVNLAMQNSSSGAGIGSLYFNVTSVDPLAGTWDIRGGSVVVAGTWTSALAVP